MFESGTTDYAELALDIALQGGGKGTLKGGKFIKTPGFEIDKSASVSGVKSPGFGIGLTGWGYGVSGGVDFGKKRLLCFNQPKQKCPCNK